MSPSFTLFRYGTLFLQIAFHIAQGKAGMLSLQLTVSFGIAPEGMTQMQVVIRSTLANIVVTPTILPSIC